MTVLGLMMRERRISAAYIAGELGCTTRSVSRWATGRSYPLQTYTRSLERIFRAPIEELLAPIILQEKTNGKN